MPKQKSNTQIIKDLVAGIPALSETWDKAIKDQTDDTISAAWNATLEHFLPNNEKFHINPTDFIKKCSKNDLTKLLNKSSVKILMGIGNILALFEKNELCFGEKEGFYQYSGLGQQEGGCGVEISIVVTKTLDGYIFSLREDDSEKESWIGENLLKEMEAEAKCKEYEEVLIEDYRQFDFAFSIKKIGCKSGKIYLVYVAGEDDEYQFFYVEGTGRRGDYANTLSDAISNSTLSFNNKSTWKITEGKWKRDEILKGLSFIDEEFDIEWVSAEEEK